MAKSHRNGIKELVQRKRVFEMADGDEEFEVNHQNQIILKENSMMVLKGTVNFNKGTKKTPMTLSDKLQMLYESADKLQKLITEKHYKPH